MLDSWTLWVSTGFMALISAMALLLAWMLKIHQNRNVAGFRDWVAGRILALVGMILLVLQFDSNILMLQAVGNMLIITGLWLEFDGLRHFISQPATSHKRSIAGGLAVLFLMAWLALGVQSAEFIDILASLILMLIGIWCAITIWPERESQEVWALRGVAWVFGIHSFAHGIYLLAAMVYLADKDNSFAARLTDYGFGFETMFFVVAGAIGYIAITAEDLHAELQRQAESDSLTGVYNRRAFHTIAKHSLLRQHRKQDDMSVVILDLDHFKNINDLHGHATGDQVLRTTAQVIDVTRRESDLLARFGGEEFVVLLPATGPSAAMNAAERLRAAIETVPILLDDGNTLHITASLGVASLDIDELIDDVDILINRADEALYEAKDSGRNAVRAWQRPIDARDEQAV